MALWTEWSFIGDLVSTSFSNLGSNEKKPGLFRVYGIILPIVICFFLNHSKDTCETTSVIERICSMADIS